MKKTSTDKVFRTTEKISLNEEGILLRCINQFIGKPRKVTGAKGKANYIVPQVQPDDVVMFLGCWHYQIKFRGAVPDKIAEREIKTPTWTTSLRFLSGQTIVKVDWVGIDKLDQLYEAARFIYSHFRLVNR